MAAAALAATSLVACSGGSSKEDFIAAADDACREADEDVRALRVPRAEDGIRDYVREAQAISEGLVAELRELEPPEGDREQVDAMIDGLDRATALLEPLAQATLDRDAKELEELQEKVEQTTDEVSRAAKAYGFDVCGAQVPAPIR